MAYNQDVPVDNTADIRENFRALKEDKIVTAASATTADSATTAESCTGNAATATKLATARTISLTGDATGSATFDGSADMSIVVDVTSADTATVCTGNAATTTKLETARTINGVSFDGSSDITISSTEFDSGYLFSTNGYQKLSNGLIFQWGKYSKVISTNDGGAVSITFPTEFPNACLNITFAEIDASTGDSGRRLCTIASQPTQTGFTLQLDNVSGISSTMGVYYMVIGW